MRAVIYETYKDYLGQCRGYHVWEDTCTHTYQVTKDDPCGDIRPPEGSWGYNKLSSLLRLKDIPDSEIRAFLTSCGKKKDA